MNATAKPCLAPVLLSDSSLARDTARDIGRGLVGASDLTRIVTDASDSGLARDIARDLTNVNYVIRDLSSSSVLNIPQARADIGALAHGLARTLASADQLSRDYGMAFDPDVGSELIRTLAGAQSLARALAHGSVRDLTRVRNLARADDRARIPASARASANANANTDANERERRQAGQPARSAVGLLTIAASLLPAADRGRYNDEFAAELAEMVKSEAGVLPQVRYALHQLRSAPEMAFVLRSPRRNAAP